MIDMKIQITAPVSADDLLLQIYDSMNDFDEMLELIKNLELTFENWELTEKCFRYFAGQMVIMTEEGESLEPETIEIIKKLI